MDKTNFLLDYCKSHNLYVSGGSDYHGKIKPKVILGESIPGVRIPYELRKSGFQVVEYLVVKPIDRI